MSSFIRLSPRRCEDVEGSPGPAFNSKRVSVALRPEDMERAAPGAENAFDAQVITVEYGGRDSLIKVKSAFGELWARVAGEFTEGERITLRVLMFLAVQLPAPCKRIAMWTS